MATKKILIIEDEPAIKRALHDKLVRLSDVEVLEAGDGSAGLELALQSHPNVILLDIVMPVMDGITMLKKLREDNWGKTVPVLILTNLTPNDESIMSQITTTEPSYFFVKANKTIDEVAQTVRDILSK